MDGTFTIPGLLCLLLVAASAADPRNHDDLYGRLERLEQRYARDMANRARDMVNYARDVANLEDRVVTLETANVHLEDRVVTLETANQRLVAENDINKAEIASLKTQVEECKQIQWDNKGDEEASNVVDVDTELPKQKEAVDESRIVDADSTTDEHKDVDNKRKRALIEGTNIAFTAYVDHDLDNQGSNQVLVFNKVLLNHGNAYNNFSGMFTAPMAGVYSFTFFIGQRDVNQYYATLVVNNQHTVDAVSETLHVKQDLQGGNSANLMLAQGDTVFIRHLSNIGTHVEGANSLRISSFSGFLIYPVEEQGSIIGK